MTAKEVLYFVRENLRDTKQPYRFSDELLDFARKMMQKISTDIDNHKKNSTSGNLFID